MSAVATAPSALAHRERSHTPRLSLLRAFLTLSRRRFALSARTPREIVVPLVNPVFFALVIAPALAKVAGGTRNGIDYMTFVAIATVGLLVPLNCLFAGIGVPPCRGPCSCWATTRSR
jgi:hypothetical protein